jgi:pimeloyl-ACP methyl ester carboxylesterase
MTTQVCNFRNGKVTFTSKGKGRTLVLLHGFLESKAVWFEVHERLAKSFRVIAIDLPGFGESDCYGYVHTMELMAQSVKVVLDQLRLKRVVLLGHSMGGYVALAFAELYPEFVRGLGLLNSTAYADSNERKINRQRAIAAVKANHQLYTNQTIENLFAPKNVKYLKDKVNLAKRIAKDTSNRAIVAALEGMRDRINREIILRFAAFPILFVFAELDRVLPYETVIEQIKLCQYPHILFSEYDGHMCFLESPETTIKALKKFSRIAFSKNFSQKYER